MRNLDCQTGENACSLDTDRAYVLVTAARNEERFIGATIEAVTLQTILPLKWVIVSDASEDNTDEIVRSYAKQHSFIEFIRLENDRSRSFASKVYAMNIGFERIRDVDSAFIGNLDADVTFAAGYFAALINEFIRDPRLGLAGGFIHERQRGDFAVRSMNSTESVAGAVQLFRRKCFEAIGGIVPLKYGGEDWCAEIMSRMNGWRVRSMPHLRVFHHKPAGGGFRGLKYCYHQGMMDFAIGSDPLFTLAKCLRRVTTKPYVAGAAARLAGFLLASRRNERRPVPEELVAFLRREQRERLFRPLQKFRWNAR
jgi:poly-beta-1,6-N-acetyl-D-glucosamine synthase